MAHRPPTTLREKLVKIGAKVAGHGRSVTFHSAEIASMACPPFAAMKEALPVASRSPDGSGVCCAGRSASSRCEMVTGPDSGADAHCATVVGNWQEPSAESRLKAERRDPDHRLMGEI